MITLTSYSSLSNNINFITINYNFLDPLELKAFPQPFTHNTLATESIV